MNFSQHQVSEFQSAGEPSCEAGILQRTALRGWQLEPNELLKDKLRNKQNRKPPHP